MKMKYDQSCEQILVPEARKLVDRIIKEQLLLWQKPTTSASIGKVTIFCKNTSMLYTHGREKSREQVTTGLKLSMWAAKVHASFENKNSMYLIKSRLTGSAAQSQNTYQEQFQF